MPCPPLNWLQRLDYDSMNTRSLLSPSILVSLHFAMSTHLHICIEIGNTVRNSLIP